MQGVVCTLHEGDDFGKLALVNDAPRAASIVLREDNCHFLRVDKEDFNRILRVSVGRATLTVWCQNFQIFLESYLICIGILITMFEVSLVMEQRYDILEDQVKYNYFSFSVPRLAMKMWPNVIFCLSRSCGLEFAKCSLWPASV